jgi:serine/threonine-protein kinase
MEHQRYKITDRLDAGGMAEVFRGIAESTVGGLKRNVAIKRILPSLTKNKKFVQMFLDEARLALHLQHANIVQVYDIGVSDGPPASGPAAAPGSDQAYFLVMEYVDGANLKVIIDSVRAQGVRVPVSQSLYIMMEVCKALAYAHELNDPENGRPLGIVHRDISPPNILISKRGEVKLADFGLAKATSQLENTDPGVVKGKFSYLSPEAARGEEVDCRSDIFAVGILLYEMLVGKRLFDGETDYQTVQLVRQANVPSLTAQNPEVTPELESIVRKALAKDPAQRYQHAEDLGDAIAQYLFSRGLKVTSRDIEQLVVRCVNERQRSKPQKPVGSLIDNLIQDEILKFTSLDEVGAEPAKKPEAAGNAPLNPDSFIDPRMWNEPAETSIPPRSSGTNLSKLSTSNPAAQSLEKLLEGASEKTTKMPVPQFDTPSPPTKSRGPVLVVILILAVVLIVLLSMLAVRH